MNLWLIHLRNLLGLIVCQLSIESTNYGEFLQGECFAKKGVMRMERHGKNVSNFVSIVAYNLQTVSREKLYVTLDQV